MPRAARVLALVVLAAALVTAPAAALQTATAEARATRLLDAKETARQELLGRDEFASVEVAQALLAVGAKAVGEAEFRRAVVAFQTAEAVARRAGAEQETAQALNGAANAFYRLGELAPAREAADAALRLHERLGDPGGQAEALSTIAKIHHARGEYEESLGLADRAGALWTAAGDRSGLAKVLNNTANILRVLGQFDEALSRHEQALRIFEEIGDRRSASVVMTGMCIDHFERGDYPAALDLCERSLALKRVVANRYDLGGTYDALGNIERARGAYVRALDYFQQALKVRQETGDKFGELETWNNIGLVHYSQGNDVLAIDAYKHGLRLNASMGGSTLAPEALVNIANSARRLGQVGRAEANYRESLRLARGRGSKTIAAECLRGLGGMALDAGRLAEAERLFTESLGVWEGISGHEAGGADAWNGLAAVSLAARRPDVALERAQRAAEISRRFEQADAQWEAATLSGIAQARLGRTDAARRSLEDAVRVIEVLRGQVVGGDQGGARFLETKLSPYHELMELAVTRGVTAEGLEWAERSKARVLADIVQRGRLDLGPSMSESDRREDARLRDAIVSLNARIQTERQRETPDAKRLAELQADRQAKRSAYETFQAALQARHPEVALRRGQARPFTLADATALLRDESVAVLEYAFTPDRCHLFVLTLGPAGVRLESHALAARGSELARRARRFRERVAARDLGFAVEARALYDSLVTPAIAQLKGRAHVVVVPDGPLWEVPFQALQDPAGRYLIETAAVSYAPSLTVLRETLRRPHHTALPTVLAMGKADFGSKGAAPPVAMMSDLGPLPDAERQVREIAALYGPGRSATYLGPEAREDTFKKEAPHHAILHLATHGVMDESSPLYSHAVLSPGGGGSSEDGLLEAWEIMDLRLDADLVVLSACETGRGRIAPGEGVVGTMWAAFVAGAQALLASQWKVESTSTTELMTAFHRGLVNGGGGKAAHLRRASLELLRRPRYAHPFYWAGFVLVGDPY